MTRRLLAPVAVLALEVLVLASDHLVNAANAPGAAKPSTVPGEDDPNAGQDQTTPVVDLSLSTVRSGGHGQAT